MLEIVAEETGYPPDLLDMDLDLEADLGIDTVKQAEVFAKIREAYGIERDDSLQLRDYPTLTRVVAFVNERSGAAAPAPASEPAPAPAPEPTPAPAPGGVEQRVLEIVAEETGYPPDLLDMDLDLEADLGIDTVKQAEVFAKIREAYGIERDDSLQLRDYPTLTRVVAFVNERSGAAAPAPARARARPGRPSPTPPPAPGGVEQRVLEIVAEETGYPPDLLDMDLDLEADLGIDTVKQAEVFAKIREAYGIERDDSLQLRDYPTLTRVVAFVNERSGAAAPAPAAEPAPAPAPEPTPPPRPAASSSGCWRSSPRRPAIRPTCSTWTSTSRPTSGSTRSSRPRSSPRSARPTGSSATTRCSCATTRP